MSSADSVTSRAGHIVWHESANESDWTQRAATAIADALRIALVAGDKTRLLLSGGTTPGPVYAALAAHELDWSRVVVGLVDERDVEPDADGSNARLLRETLLRGPAAAACFEPLRGAHQSIPQAVLAANRRWQEFLGTDTAAHATSAGVVANIGRIAAIALGMGDDGHTASLFPGAVNLPDAFDTTDPYAAIDATGCKVAGAYPHRISLTPAGLAQSGHNLLLIRGADKRAVFERALQDGGARDMPIRVAIDLPVPRLHVHWCP